MFWGPLYHRAIPGYLHVKLCNNRHTFNEVAWCDKVLRTQKDNREINKHHHYNNLIFPQSPLLKKFISQRSRNVAQIASYTHIGRNKLFKLIYVTYRCIIMIVKDYMGTNSSLRICLEILYSIRVHIFCLGGAYLPKSSVSTPSPGLMCKYETLSIILVKYW